MANPKTAAKKRKAPAKPAPKAAPRPPVRSPAAAKALRAQEEAAAQTERWRLELLNGGVTTVELAQRSGVHPSTLRRRLRQVLPPELKAELRDAVEQMLSDYLLTDIEHFRTRIHNPKPVWIEDKDGGGHFEVDMEDLAVSARAYAKAIDQVMKLYFIGGETTRHEGDVGGNRAPLDTEALARLMSLNPDLKSTIAAMLQPKSTNAA